MEPHEVDRAIQFLLSQQAQFAADLQQSRELCDKRHDQVTHAIMGLTSVVGRLVDIQFEQAQRHDALASKVEELAVSQKETQANLSSLMLVVEKYFRERTNGGGPH